MAITGLARAVSGYAMAIVLVALDAQRRHGHRRGCAERHQAECAATASKPVVEEPTPIEDGELMEAARYNSAVAADVALSRSAPSGPRS